MRKTIVMSLLLAVTILGSKAQNSAQSIELNLEQALEIALSDNPTIKVANMEIERQKYVRKETVGGLLPQLNSSGSYNYNIMNPVMFMPSGVFGPGSGGAMRMGFSNSFAGGFSLAIPLYMPTLYKTLQLNEIQMMEAVENARSSKITLANQVKKGYYSILLGQASLEVISKNIEYAKTIVKDAQNALAQGVVAEYDVITAQVQLSNLNPVLLTAENGLRVSRLMLNMLLSLPLNTEIKTATDLNSYYKFATTDSYNTFDLTDNADMKLIELQREMLDKQLEIQKTLKLPTLNAIAQYQVQTQNNSLNVGTYDWRGTAIAGLQLSIPIFAGGTKKQKEHQISNSINQLQMQRDYLSESVNVEAQTAISNLTKARGQMVANMEAREQAIKGYKISKTRFDTGAGTIVELNASQSALLQSELNFTQSIFDYMSARADLDKVIGKI